MGGLTEKQWAALGRIATGPRWSYDGNQERTLRSLARRGLVAVVRAPIEQGGGWHLTEAGRVLLREGESE